MKRFISQLFVLVSMLFIAASCQKAPFITLNTPRSFTFTRDGGTQNITFTCNRDWSVSSSESWIQVSPSSGKASDGEVTVKVTCAPNSTYDPRSATITVKVEELTEAISISQETGIGLLVSPKTFDLTNAEQTIEIEVQKNVQYTVAIDNESASWIRQGGTKALTMDKITFTIAANTSYDNREGKITFKQLDGNLSETVVVKQAWTEGLIPEQTVFEVPYEGGSVDVKMSSNVNYDVIPSVDWIHHTGTKALTPSTVSLTIDSNETYIPREGTVTIRKREGNLSSVITIKQAAMIPVQSVTIDKEELFLEIGESTVLTATISPSDATLQTVTWSSSDESVATIDETGKVTAIQKGKATISAKAEEKEAISLVYVDCIPDDEIWYTTTDGTILSFQSYSLDPMPEIVNHIYSEGRARVRFKTAPTELVNTLFYSQERLKSVVLPDGITALRTGCFSWCTSLKSVTLPDNLKAIEAGAFHLCTLMEEITIPDSVDNIEESVFACCSSLYKIVSKYTKEDNRTLVINGVLIAAATAGLKTYTVPEGVTRIGSSVFAGSIVMESSLQEVTLPKTLMEIGTAAFRESNITSISIPASAVSIGESAFLGCRSLCSVILPDGLKRIENNVFGDCVSIKSVNLPEQLEYIGEGAFNGTSITSIIIPRYVSEIVQNAFGSCYSLESVYVKPLTPPSITPAYGSGSLFSSTSCPVYVSPSSVSSYKNAVGWNELASRIEPWYAQPEAIDMGLSVKWASFNVGAIVPDDYGEYYAWGETMKKASYDWNSYVFGKQDALTKYTKEDGKEVLDPEDDAAHVKLAGTWRMPTSAEFEELRSKCTWTWTTIEGVVGSLVTAQNGNSIFLPAGGSKYQSGISSVGLNGHFWTSSLYHSENATTVAWEFYVDEIDPRKIGSWRYNGNTIRAVTE